MRIEKISSRATAILQKGTRRLERRRRSWEDFEKRCLKVFQKFKSAQQSEQGNPPIIIGESDDSDPSFKSVTLKFGWEKTGIADFREANKYQAVVQHGCALHIAQGLYGELHVMLYPYWNSLQAERVTPYVYRTISKPWSVTDRQIAFWIRLLVALSLWSSYRGKVRGSDWFYLKWIQARSLLRRIYHSDWSRAAEQKIDRLFGKAEQEDENE